MHKYVYSTKQFSKNGPSQGRVHSSEVINVGPTGADDLQEFIEANFKTKNNKLVDSKGKDLKYTINDKGELKTSDPELLNFIRNNYTGKIFGDTSTIKGSVSGALVEDAPEMCKTIIKAIVGRFKVHLEDAMFKKRNKESKGDFSYIAPQLGPAAKDAQSQARKRLEVKQRNAAVRGYSVKPISIKKGQVLIHDLLDTEIEITDIDRVNPDGSIDIKYKFGDLGAFNKLKDKDELKGEAEMTLTPEDLQNFNVE